MTSIQNFGEKFENFEKKLIFFIRDNIEMLGKSFNL